MTNGVSASGSAQSVNAILAENATRVHAQLDALTEQASTGLVAQTYAGLGNDALVPLSLNPTLTALNTYQTNINQAMGRMGLTQSAMTQIQQIATTFVAAIPTLNTLNASDIDSVAANARTALQQVADLLDTKDGAVYVFGGQDTANAPVPSADAILASGFFTKINTAVAGLATNGSAATIAATLATATSNAPGTSPFSAYMSQPTSALAAPVVQTGPNSTVQTGLLASANTVAVSAGPSTTGSYMRDLMRALATLGSLSSSQASDPNFGGLVQDTGTSLNGAVAAMATDVGVLGDSQTNLGVAQTQLTATTTALTTQVSAVQDADMTVTLSKLTATQTQLQLSYRLIASAQSMMLVNFLPSS